jgi:hypothetical protein
MRPTDPRREARFATDWFGVSQARIRASYFPQKATCAVLRTLLTPVTDAEPSTAFSRNQRGARADARRRDESDGRRQAEAAPLDRCVDQRRTPHTLERAVVHAEVRERLRTRSRSSGFPSEPGGGHGVKLRVARDGGPPRARGAPRSQVSEPRTLALDRRSTAVKLDSSGLDVPKRRRNAGLSSNGESARYGWSNPSRQVSDGSPARRAVEEPRTEFVGVESGVMERHHRERGSPASRVISAS